MVRCGGAHKLGEVVWLAEVEYVKCSGTLGVVAGTNTVLRAAPQVDTSRGNWLDLALVPVVASSGRSLHKLIDSDN